MTKKEKNNKAVPNYALPAIMLKGTSAGKPLRKLGSLTCPYTGVKGIPGDKVNPFERKLLNCNFAAEYVKNMRDPVDRLASAADSEFANNTRKKLSDTEMRTLFAETKKECLDKYSTYNYEKNKLAEYKNDLVAYNDDEKQARSYANATVLTGEYAEKIKNSGVDVIRVMLHVGLGTFRPVKCENIEEHKMHSEFFTVTADAAERINAVRRRGGRIIAVGTTSCRTLESAADDEGTVHAESRDTDIFIYPPYKFKAVDALITNFHLPESTLLMLISAFADRETVMKAYAEAVKERYRFFSFGDAMLIL